LQGSTTLTATNPTATLAFDLKPFNSTYQDLAVSVLGSADLAEVSVNQDGNVTITGKYDGKFSVVIGVKNGSKVMEPTTQIDFVASNLATLMKDPYEKVKGAQYDLANSTFKIEGDGGLGGITSRCWVGYQNYAFGKNGATKIVLYGGTSSGTTQLGIWDGNPDAGGTLIDTVIFGPTGTWGITGEQTYDLPNRIIGAKDIYIVMIGGIAFGGFKFIEGEPILSFNQIEAESSTQIFGDTFELGTYTDNSGQIQGAVKNIGNNVSLTFEDMNFGTIGTDRIAIHGFTPNSQNPIQIRYTDDAGKEIIQQVPFVKTGTYGTQEFAIEPITGIRDITFLFMPGSSFNFDWFQFIKTNPKSPYQKINGIQYDTASTPFKVEGGSGLGGISSRSWAGYHNYDFGPYGSNRVTIYGGTSNYSPKIWIYDGNPDLNGTLFAEIKLQPTGSWSIAGQQTVTLPAKLVGKHDLYFVFISGIAFGGFEFTTPSPNDPYQKVNAIQYSTATGTFQTEAGTGIGGIYNRCVFGYQYYDFGTVGSNRVTIYGGTSTNSSPISIYDGNPDNGGRLIVKTNLNATGSWAMTGVQIVTLPETLVGTHDIYYVFEIGIAYGGFQFISVKRDTVALQVSTGTTSASPITNLRLLFGVDSLQYKSAGFRISGTGAAQGKSLTLKTATVFDTITVEGKQYSGNNFDAHYIVAVEIEGIENGFFDNDVIIEAFVQDITTDAYLYKDAKTININQLIAVQS